MTATDPHRAPPREFDRTSDRDFVAYYEQASLSNESRARFKAVREKVPVQEEFDLPLYSWYPRPLKRCYERLAATTRPELVNHARYPAVHWFSFYGLRDYLARLGFDCLDGFDMIDASGQGVLAGLVLSAVKRVGVLRWFGHVLITVHRCVRPEEPLQRALGRLDRIELRPACGKMVLTAARSRSSDGVGQEPQVVMLSDNFELMNSWKTARARVLPIHAARCFR